jgi:sugar lactone lactonase YvrE
LRARTRAQALTHAPLSLHPPSLPQGPRALLFDAAGSLFFTDAGPEGDTGLHNRAGSVFVIVGEGASRLLRPVALRCLANPTGIALSASGSAVFVAEAAENRVLRYTQRPPGVWHGAVFHTFAGCLGPSALVCDAARGLLYVARPEVPDAGARGVVSVLSMEGALLKEFEVPTADVSALALSPDGTRLLVADATADSVVSILL